MIDVDLFIDAIRERPALYNPTHEHYTRKEVRMSMWNEIGLIVHPDWATVDERFRKAKTLLMQKKWKSLKDCFNRELRLRRTRDPNRHRKPYEFFEKLMFLLVTKDREPSQPAIHLEPFQEIVVKTEPMEDPESEQLPLVSSGGKKTLQKKGRPRKKRTMEVLEDAGSDQLPLVNSTMQEAVHEGGRLRKRRATKASEDAGSDQQPLVNSTTQEALQEQWRARKRTATEAQGGCENGRLPFLNCLVQEAFQGQEGVMEEDAENESDKLFLLSFLKDLKKLPMTTKYWVRMKFSEIMHQAAMSIQMVQDDFEDDEELEEEEEFPNCVLMDSAAHLSGND